MSKNLIKRLLREGIDSKSSVGVLIRAQDTGNFLLLKRAGDPYKDHWSMLSGGMESGEDRLEALKREVEEEIGVSDSRISYEYVSNSKSVGSGSPFYYYKGNVKKEFKPTLDHENSDYKWVAPNDLPSKMFPKTADKIENF